MEVKSPELTEALERLMLFAGKWKGGGVFLEGAGPGAGMTVDAEEAYMWLPGGYFLADDSVLTFEGGSLTAHRIFGYSQQEKAYTMQAFDSIGYARTYKGHVNGNEWHFAGEFERVTIAISDDGSHISTFWENTNDGKTWTPLCKTEQTKQ